MLHTIKRYPPRRVRRISRKHRKAARALSYFKTPLPIQPRRPLRGTEPYPQLRGRVVHLSAQGLGIRPAAREAYLAWLDTHAARWVAEGRVTEHQLTRSGELVALLPGTRRPAAASSRSNRRGPL